MHLRLLSQSETHMAESELSLSEAHYVALGGLELTT